MKILFLTLAKINSVENQGIYHDLLRKFRDNGHEVTIVNPAERKLKKPTKYTFNDGVSILSVWTTNIQKTNLIEKGITTILIEFYFYFAIRKYVSYKDFDLILYSTPPVTFTNLIKYVKKASNAKTYLLLKDIFPQNAVDLNFIRYNSLFYKYFRAQEKTLYKISDYIGCMSPANLNYILNNNSEIERNKVEVNPNSIDIKGNNRVEESSLYEKYRIPKDKVIFVFGGNIGTPQGIDYLKKHILNCKSIKDAFFLIVGNGTKFQDFKEWIFHDNISNVRLIKELPKSEYDEILGLSHVGLIFLNPLFTIPNFPSRILSYMQNKIPVICATDRNTDIGNIASENNFGFSCLTSDLDSFFNYVNKLLNKEIRNKMGENAFEYLSSEYNVEYTYNKIIEKINYK
jgi:glycosyltransferase involved in cell wall biosynthesis